MQAEYILSYKINLYFHDYKFAIKNNEDGHSDRNIDCELKRQRSIEQKIDSKFIRIDPDKEDFNIFRAPSEIYRHIKQSTKRL